MLQMSTDANVAICAGTTIFSKAVVVPGQAVQPECKIPPFAEYGGIKIPTPCLFSGLWP